MPLVNTSQPPTTVSVVTPRTVKLLGLSSSTLAFVVPLLIVIRRTSVVAPLPPKLALPVPVKVMPVPAVSALVEKSSVPLLVRLPAILRICPVCVPAGFDCSVPPPCTVTSVPTPSVRAVVCSNCSVPATDTEYATAAVSIVTVVPPAIVTASLVVGTMPVDQVPGALHRPEPSELFGVGVAVVWLPLMKAVLPSVNAYTRQK